MYPLFQRSETHSPEKFLQQANDYLAKAPPNYLMAADSVWLAAVHSIKQKFIDAGIHVESDKALGEASIAVAPFLHKEWHAAGK